MLFNVDLLRREETVFERWPELNKIPEFTEGVVGFDTTEVLKYIFLVYDRNSPVVINNKENLIKRKYESAVISGFELKDGRFKKSIEEVIKCKNESVNRMIFAYVRLFGDDDVAYLTGLKDALYSILPDISAGEIKDISKVKELKKEIDLVTDKILVRDNTNSLYLDLYKYIEREKLGLRPEDYALKNPRNK